MNLQDDSFGVRVVKAAYFNKADLQRLLNDPNLSWRDMIPLADFAEEQGIFGLYSDVFRRRLYVTFWEVGEPVFNWLNRQNPEEDALARRFYKLSKKLENQWKTPMEMVRIFDEYFVLLGDAERLIQEQGQGSDTAKNLLILIGKARLGMVSRQAKIIERYNLGVPHVSSLQELHSAMDKVAETYGGELGLIPRENYVEFYWRIEDHRPGDMLEEEQLRTAYQQFGEVARDLGWRFEDLAGDWYKGYAGLTPYVG